jgi:hypothetical protein
MSFRIKAALFLISLFISNPTLAADKNPLTEIRQLISTDCSLALSTFQSLDEVQREEALNLLFEVIRFRISQINQDFAMQTEFVKAPEGVLDHLALAQSLSPANQRVAKQCVLSILPLYPQKTQIIVPELVRTSQDPTEDFSIRVRLQESAYQIAKHLSGPNFSINAEVLSELIKIQIETPSDFSKQILSLFYRNISQELTHTFLNLQCTEQSCEEFNKSTKLLEFLAEIPDSYESLLPLLITFVTQEPTKLIGKEVLLSKAFSILKLIFDFESESRSLLVDPKIRLSLFSLFPSLNNENRDIIEHGLMVLANFGEPFILEVLKLCASSDSDLRLRSVRFLAQASISSKDLKTAEDKLRKDENLGVRLEAYARFSPKANTVKLTDALASEILKELKAKDKNLINSLNLALTFLEKADQYAALSNTSVLNELNWEAVKLVYSDNSFPSLRERLTLLLSKRQGQLRTKIKSLSQSKLESDQLLALNLYRYAADSSSKISELSLILDMSGSVSPSLSAAAELVLFERDNLTINSKANLKISPKIIAEFTNETQKSEQVLAELNSLACEKIQPLFEICLKKDNFGAYCKQLFLQSERCWANFVIADYDLNKLEKLFSYQGQALRHKLNDKALWSKVSCNLALAAARQNLLDDQQICHALSLNSCVNYSSELQSLALTKVATKPEFNAECLSIIKSAFEANRSLHPFAATLLKTIFLLDPTSIDINVLFKDALENQSSELIIATAELGYSQNIIASLKDYFDNQSLSLNETEFLLKIVEGLGSKAKAILPSILKYEQQTELAYQTKRAIIAIAEDNQVLLANTLQSLLGSLSFPGLLKDINLTNLAKAVSILESNPSLNLSYFERKDFNHLKCKLEQKPDLCFETL